MRIELELFKFCDFKEEKIVVNIADNITTFVGPNGAGKTSLLRGCYEALNLVSTEHFNERIPISPENFDIDVNEIKWKRININFYNCDEIESSSLHQNLRSIIKFSISLVYDDDDDDSYLFDHLIFNNKKYLYRNTHYIYDCDNYAKLVSEELNLITKLENSDYANDLSDEDYEVLENDLKYIREEMDYYRLDFEDISEFWKRFEFPDILFIEENKLKNSIDDYVDEILDYRNELHSDENNSSYKKELLKINDFLNSKVAVGSDKEKSDRSIEIFVDKKSREHLSMGTFLGLSFYTLIHKTKDNCIVFWDEPENSLHTTRRCKIVELMKKDNRKYVVATHQPEFCATNDTRSNVYKLWSKFETFWSNPQCYIRKAESIEQNFAILKSLGMEPSKVLFTSNCVIWVEGPSDIIYWRFWISKYLEGLNRELIEGFDYTFMIYGGSGLNALSIYKNKDDSGFVDVLSLTPASIFLYDTDLNKEDGDKTIGTNNTLEIESSFKSLLKPRVQKIINQTNSLDESMNHITIPTYGREIENYLTNETIINVLKNLYEVNENDKNDNDLLESIFVDRWDSFDEVIIDKIENASTQKSDNSKLLSKRKKGIARHKKSLVGKIGFASIYVDLYKKDANVFNSLNCNNSHIKKIVDLIIKIKEEYNN